jgi:hypothetical protein
MDWKQLLASITGSVDEELRLRNAYLAAENRILRNQIKARRLLLTDAERKTLAEMGHKLGRQALQEIAMIAQPDTILAWHRKFMDQHEVSSLQRQSVGRPRIAKELEDLVVRMARENRSWGYDRIVGALANLGYAISDQTVGNILKRHDLPPAPARKKTLTWQEFIRIHMDVLVAADFFSSALWTWLGFVISYVYSFSHLDRCAISGVSRTSTLYVQRMLMLPSRLPDGYAYAERWGRSVMEQGLTRLLQCGPPVQWRIFSTLVSHDHHIRLSSDRGKVVCLPIGKHHPIWAGPIRYRQRRSRLQPVYTREAA